MRVKAISNVLGVSRKAIRKTLSRFFVVLEKLKPFYLCKIGGNYNICEVDESKFGKRKYNRGHSVEGVWVLGIVERFERKRIILKVVEKRNRETINLFFNNYVLGGSTVFTDCWKGYCGLSELGYVHKTVNHSLYFVDPISLVHTNSIEGNWNAIKAGIPPRCRTKKTLMNILICLC